MSFRWLIPTLYIVFLMLPIYWLLNMSFKTTNEILGGFSWFPANFTVESLLLTPRRTKSLAGSLIIAPISRFCNQFDSAQIRRPNIKSELLRWEIFYSDRSGPNARANHIQYKYAYVLSPIRLP